MSQDDGKLRCQIAQVPLYISHTQCILLHTKTEPPAAGCCPPVDSVLPLPVDSVLPPVLSLLSAIFYVIYEESQITYVYNKINTI
jgi:hypothetical protein